MAWKDEIQHVVVLMLENQSFDRLLGFVRLDDASERIDGLTGNETMPAALTDPARVVRLERGTAPALYLRPPGISSRTSRCRSSVNRGCPIRRRPP
jgi:hypothetical protein